MWVDRFGGVDDLVFYIFCGVAAVIVVLGLISLFVPCCIPHVNAYTPGGTMDFNIILGGYLITLTVLLRGVNTTWASATIFSAFCQIYPAALLIGLTLFMGGFLIKGATIYSYKWYKKPSAVVEEWKPNLAIWGLVIAIAIVAAVWCVLFKPTLTELTGSQYACYSSEADFEWKVATSAWHGIILLLAFIMAPLQCKKSRKTPCSQESSALTLVVINTVLSVVGGLCIHYLYKDATPTVYYAIIGGLELWMVLFAYIAMMAAKITVAKNEANTIEYDDERYDVIKEDQESGEMKELATSGNLYNSIVIGTMNSDNSEQEESQPTNNNGAIVRNQSIVDADQYNYSIRPSITVLDM